MHQPDDAVAESGGGDRRRVVSLAQAGSIQQRGPGGPAGLQAATKKYGPPGTNWSSLRFPHP
ncbi:hypothetical protein POF50_018970 [Streptomyces sp. SL13]|uniref:Uncharacterized protein n=1 Tax=Streptantibioticus silvisoli TaxID=2705255 RepID=A0AA90H168_9ACTN|nr:hypothetical protein [Streptantibioticus silvisoli]MDI5967127.1 hypothetical protein [Streptantibioticus silvisoli]MDI5971394.1 hypothetical protein [Streptantibioticus silvisoli]